MKKQFEFTPPILNVFCVGATFGILIGSHIHWGLSKGTLFILALFLFQAFLLYLQIHNYNANQKEKPKIKRAFGENSPTDERGTENL